MNNVLYQAVAAGVLIGMGGYANLTLGGTLGSFLFALGLLSVICFRTPLYTGLVSDLRQYKCFPDMLAVLGLNFVGAIFMGLLVDLHGAVPVLDIAAKLEKNMVATFIDAVICGMCVTIAVKSKEQLMVIMSVMIFVLLGAEHCVADAFYFSAVSLQLTSISDVAILIGFVLWVAIGNTVGGLLFSKIGRW